MSSSESENSGRKLGRYHLVEPIGGGPTGEAYRGKVYGVAGFERQFAIKRFHPEFIRNPEAAAEVARAARTYAGLEHPRIARMQEFGVAGGDTFAATEMVEGLDLRQLLATTFDKGEPLQPGSALTIVTHAGRAIGYAHGRGICHLGVCPTNIICSPSGEVKVTDFGFLPPRLPKRPADDFTLLARIGYLAPEQLIDEETTPATDVFQLGVVLYELLSGQRPFRGKTPLDISQAILSGAPPDPPVPAPVTKLLQRALARSPFERYPDASAMADAIEATMRVSPMPGNPRDAANVVRRAVARRGQLDPNQMSGAFSVPLPAPPAAQSPLARALNRSTIPPPIPSGAPARRTMLGVSMTERARAALMPAAPPPEAPRNGESDRAQTALDLHDSGEILEFELPDSPIGLDLTDGQADEDPTEVHLADGTRPPGGRSDMVAALTPSEGVPVLDDAQLAELGISEGSGAYVSPTPPRPPTPPPRRASSVHPIATPPDRNSSARHMATPVDSNSSARHMATPPARPSTARPIATPPPMDAPPPPPPGVPEAPQVLEAFSDGSGVSGLADPANAPVARAPSKKSRVWIAAGATAVLVAVGVLGYTQLAGSDDNPRPAKPAQTGKRQARAAAPPAGPADAGPRRFARTKADASPTPPSADAGPRAVARAAPDAGSTVEPHPAAGKSSTLTIESTPPRATVYLDGAKVGLTPYEQDATADRHRLALIKAGYRLYAEDIDGDQPIHVQLDEVTPFNGQAGIKVRCKKKNRYYVILDGSDTGQLCPTERLGVPMGEHTVEIYDPVTDSRSRFPAAVKETKHSLRVRVD